MEMRYGPDGDTLRYSGGMIRWFFRVGTGIYQVNSQQYWEELPRAEILGVLYRHDRKRLTQWLAQRERQEEEARKLRLADALALQRAAMGVLRSSGRGRPPLPEEERLRRQRERWREDNHRRHPPKAPPLELSQKLKDRLRRYDERAKAVPDPTLRAYAALVSDHQYIEAMFWLYSQERCRLLA